MTLPDCMMPDGAEPCIGYSELEAQLAELKKELGRRSAWHHPHCRKMIYDLFSSPCTCESEYEWQLAELRAENERLRSILAANPLLI